jgi:hypothetical protein
MDKEFGKFPIGKSQIEDDLNKVSTSEQQENGRADTSNF